ncbi:MAG: hypothetical protein KAR20_10185, partial [Candidatus Heimdallarchaeota archaeon]|nr:hypothetical protein [Candidatus Heimdallarchaeota archaeon]
IIPQPSSLLNEIFHKKILTGDDLLFGNAQGQISTGFTKNLQRAWRGRRILGTLLKFRSILKQMDVARSLYENYPESSSDFLPWREKILSLYNEN